MMTFIGILASLIVLLPVVLGYIGIFMFVGFGLILDLLALVFTKESFTTSFRSAEVQHAVNTSA